MKYPELKEPCKSAIEKGKCMGCVGLAEEDWKEPEKCPYMPSVEECIAQIYKNLGIQEKIGL